MNRIRLPFVRNISALSASDNYIYLVDYNKGTLCKIDIINQDSVSIKFSQHSFTNTTALLLEKNRIFYINGDELTKGYFESDELSITHTYKLSGISSAVGIAKANGFTFVADITGKVITYDKDNNYVDSWNTSNKLDGITLHKHRSSYCLLLLDSINRSIYAYSFKGYKLFTIPVPHEGASGIASIRDSKNNKAQLYIAYVHNTWEIFDDASPESETGNRINIQLDKNAYNVFIEPLTYQTKTISGKNKYCISNGYRTELKYYCLISPRKEIISKIAKIEPDIRMSIPTNTLRQKVISIEPIGQLKSIIGKDSDGEDIIEFKLEKNKLDRDIAIFGYKAVVDLYNIKYTIQNTSLPIKPTSELRKFLNAEKKYDMHRKEMQSLANELLASIPEEVRNNTCTIAKTIRDYVYSKLEYRYNKRYTTPVETLEDGEGTCGKYTELILGLLRLCGIPSRAVGDYKVPYYKLEYGLLNNVCQPDYDHVWIEFFAPEIGWVPMESSSDDLPEIDDRFFAALPWTNIENSRTEKSLEVVVPGSWKAIDEDIQFSDYFEQETEITVIKELF